jgi:hypothetical protein
MPIAISYHHKINITYVSITLTVIKLLVKSKLLTSILLHTKWNKWKAIVNSVQLNLQLCCLAVHNPKLFIILLLLWRFVPFSGHNLPNLLSPLLLISCSKLPVLNPEQFGCIPLYDIFAWIVLIYSYFSETSVEVSKQIQVLHGGFFSPTPNPKPGGPGYLFLSESSPLTCPAWKLFLYIVMYSPHHKTFPTIAAHHSGFYIVTSCTMYYYIEPYSENWYRLVSCKQASCFTDTNRN